MVMIREWLTEVTRINMEFWTICRAFEENIRQEKPENIQDSRSFTKFEKLWARFAKTWEESDPPKLTRVMTSAFRSFAIGLDAMPKTWKWAKQPEDED